MLTLKFSGKRAGETDLMDEAEGQRLYTSRTFIAGSMKTAIYKCILDESGSSEGQFLARFHNHVFTSDELEIEGVGLLKASDCVQKRGKTTTFAMPSRGTYEWKPGERGYLLSAPDGREVAQVFSRSYSFHHDRRRRRTSITISGNSDSRDFDYAVVICLYLMSLEERRGILGGALGESVGTMLTISLAPTGFLRW